MSRHWKTDCIVILVLPPGSASKLAISKAMAFLGAALPIRSPDHPFGGSDFMAYIKKGKLNSV